MPFEIVRNDIVKMQVDAIVNTANPDPVVGTGVDTAVHAAAGPALLEARKEVGALAVGEAAATPAFDLPAKYVIHVAGPVWVDGEHGEEDLLKKCYRSALEVAVAQGCETVAFPLLSSGNYGFPKDVALRAAIAEFGTFLLDHDMLVYLVVFGEDAYRLSSNLFSSVQSYIDEHYVAEKAAEEYAPESAGAQNLYSAQERRRRAAQQQYFNAAPSMASPEPDEDGAVLSEEVAEYSFAKIKPKASLEDMIRDMDASFSDTLIALIDATGEKPSTIYKKANISKQLYSKINSDSNYQPLKTTAIAFCIALELSLDETQALLAKAGYTLSNSILFDVVVASFIARENYDIIALNIALFERDLSLIGGK